MSDLNLIPFLFDMAFQTIIAFQRRGHKLIMTQNNESAPSQQRQKLVNRDVLL